MCARVCVCVCLCGIENNIFHYILVVAAASIAVESNLLLLKSEFLIFELEFIIILRNIHIHVCMQRVVAAASTAVCFFFFFFCFSIKIRFFVRFFLKYATSKIDSSQFDAMASSLAIFILPTTFRRLIWVPVVFFLLISHQ